MTVSNRVADEMLRKDALELFMESAIAHGEVDVKLYKSNSFCYPVVDTNGEEKWVQVTVSIPKGQRGGEKFDGYVECKAYEVKVENDRIKALKKAEEKAKKIAKDEKARKAKADANK